MDMCIFQIEFMQVKCWRCVKFSFRREGKGSRLYSF